MLKRFATFLLVILALASVGQALAQGKVQLTIESWRNDDLKIWRDTIIPAFTKKHPNIEIVFAPDCAHGIQRRFGRQAKSGYSRGSYSLQAL